MLQAHAVVWIMWTARRLRFKGCCLTPPFTLLGQSAVNVVNPKPKQGLPWLYRHVHGCIRVVGVDNKAAIAEEKANVLCARLKNRLHPVCSLL